MTTEREFGRFTQCELEAAIAQALEEERGSRFGLVVVWLLIGATAGCLWTLVLGYGFHCFNSAST
jgi:hypothetical protein